jgi:DNA-binding response OmpR family regulator
MVERALALGASLPITARSDGHALEERISGSRLTSWGSTLRSEANVTAIASTVPDLVYLDLRLPQLDGLGGLRSLRAPTR